MSYVTWQWWKCGSEGFLYQIVIYFPFQQLETHAAFLSCLNPCCFPQLSILKRYFCYSREDKLPLSYSVATSLRIYKEEQMFHSHTNEEQVWRIKLSPSDSVLFLFLHTSFSVKLIHSPVGQLLRL